MGVWMVRLIGVRGGYFVVIVVHPAATRVVSPKIISRVGISSAIVIVVYPSVASVV